MASKPVIESLAVAPQRDISNVLITARVASVDATRGFYRGTRFDQAGVVTSLKLNGHEFYGPWFDATASDVLDYTYDTAEKIVAGPDSAASGPVEEFSPLNFKATPGSHFVKIGVGILYQPDAAPYDHYRHYRILDGGQRTTRITPRSVSFTQTLYDAGTAYIYTKTLELVPTKPELLITHVLRNIGATEIRTTVYDHNFLRLSSVGDRILITFPFRVSAQNPPDPNLLRLSDRTIRYLRPLKTKERISFPILGFGESPKDYDFRLINLTNGSSVHVQGDQPLIRLNIFSIDKVQSVEPMIALDVMPGQEKRWSYRYTFKAATK